LKEKQKKVDKFQKCDLYLGIGFFFERNLKLIWLQERHFKAVTKQWKINLPDMKTTDREKRNFP